MKVVAIDIGRSAVKVVAHNHLDEFPAVIGADYRDIVDLVLGQRDIVLEWQGKKYFGGALAIRESEYAVQDSRSTKLHDHTKLLAVMAMHRAVQNGNRLMVVTGYPIGQITVDVRQKVRELFVGEYTASVNGVEKRWTVERVEVTPEGAIAAWGVADFPKVAHVIDVGSRTVNYAVLNNRGLYDRMSGTLDFGLETVRNQQFDLFADRVASELSRRWLHQLGDVFVCGGRGEAIAKELARYYQGATAFATPQFASVIGMYQAGVIRLEKAKATEAGAQR